uniref:radial spoke head 10 homolog B-like n=1 Tax=Styela clava TaxID=7725 RepID=UPI00193A4D1B|nr:radial spoke head 10 homolog B-like [Styela clava]
MAKGRKHSAAGQGSRATSASVSSAKGKKKKDEKEPEASKQEEEQEAQAAEAELENIETKSVAESDSGKACGDMSGNVEVVDPDDGQDYLEPSLTEIIVTHYEGDRGRGGIYDGYGEAQFVSGNVFKGNFDKGHMHGKGSYIWSNGMKYEGDFCNNRITGYGTYKWPDGSVYEGEVSNGFRHGVGVFRSPQQGVSYSGQWYLGKRHGRGIMNYSEQSWYEGDWVNNARHGFGVRRYRTGNVFEGRWTNDKRHGEGTMRWLATNETYRGMWENGVQHGYGTHTWYLQRVPGSQYPLRNEYIGDFINGLRHGRGKFFYASGAVYDGEWENGKKSGWGKFIFKNGRVFEGQFDNDHMVDYPTFEISGSKTPDLAQIRTRTPVGWEEQDVCSDSLEGSGAQTLGPGLTLDIDTLLEEFPEEERAEELKQVSHLVLRNITIFRRVYSFYSALGHDRSLDNTFVMTRFQFWRFLKDCKIHHRQKSLSWMDRAIARCHAAEDIHNPMEKVLMREFLSNIVILSHFIFKDEVTKPAIKQSPNQKNAPNSLILAQCLQQLITHHVTKYSCIVKGFFMFEPRRAITALNYMDKSWQIYLIIANPNPNPPHDIIMKMRQFLFTLRDLKIVGKRLPAATALKVMSQDDPAVYADDACNLELEMTFLEFFEALIGCALYMYDAVEEDEPTAAQSQVLHQTQSRRGSTPSDILSHHPDESRLGSPTRSQSVLSHATQDASMQQLHQKSSTSQVKASTIDINPIDSGLASKESIAKVTGGASSGGFLQTLSQLTVKEQDEATTIADENESEYQDPTARNTEVNISQEDREYSTWAEKLHYFFTVLLFPAWDKMAALKTEVVRFRKEQQEKERIEAIQKEAERRTQSFHALEKVPSDEDIAAERQDEEEILGDEESQIVGTLSTAPTPPPEATKSSSSVKGKSGKGAKKKK